MQPASGNRVWINRNFLERISEPEPSPVVGPSVHEDLCNVAKPHIGSADLRSTMRISSLLTIALTLVLFGGIAAAQPKGDSKAKVKVYDFSGDTIEGDLIKPEGSTVDARDFAKHSSLITIRKNFIPEIIKSAEDL